MKKVNSLYRAIQTKFWSDNKVQEVLSPEERYVFLYLLTNEKTNLSGCYEIGFKKMSFELGYETDACKSIINRLEADGMLKYDYSTSEVLLLNWYKNNWEFGSEKYMTGVKNAIENVKSDKFKEYLKSLLTDMPVTNKTSKEEFKAPTNEYGIF